MHQVPTHCRVTVCWQPLYRKLVNLDGEAICLQWDIQNFVKVALWLRNYALTWVVIILLWAKKHYNAYKSSDSYLQDVGYTVFHLFIFGWNF